MTKITEDKREIPVMTETEVLVVGSGPAGLSAALGAAREGADTTLVERYGFFGGNITQTGVGTISWYRYEDTVDAGGIGCELEDYVHNMSDIETLVNLEKHIDWINSSPDSKYVDTELFKYAAEKLVKKENITPILHCFVVDGITQNEKIKGVITESKGGRKAILADRVIDATGDADIAERVGAPYQMADKDKLMTATVGFSASNIDVDKFLSYVNDNPGYIKDWADQTNGKEDSVSSNYFVEVFDKAREEGLIPEDALINGYWHGLSNTGEMKGLNVTRVPEIDSTDIWDLTKAELKGRQQVIWAMNALQKYAPGWEDAEIRTIGSSIGIRESRKIIGKYNLTEQDVLHQAQFEDSIGIFPEFLDAYGIVILPTTGRYFQVPYRIMVPKNIDNLLVAGRSVAGDQVSHSATRQMMCCTVTGQGAGVAAATSVKEEETTSEVDITEVQSALERQGVRIS